MKHATKKVMSFGTFDFFHAGHDYLLKKAKEMGDYLIVVIARDQTVKRIKGELPEKNEKKRLKQVKDHPSVDKAVLGEINDKYTAIKKYRPDVIALGYDQFVFTQQIEPTLIKNRINARVVRLEPYKPGMYKSSILKKSPNSINERPENQNENQTE